MKKLHFKYQLNITLDSDINHHYFSLKCLPKTETGQTVIQAKTKLNADYYSISQDAFSNKMIYGYKEQPHQNLDIYVEGKIEVHRYPFHDDHLLPIYKLPTKYTQICDEMLPLFKDEDSQTEFEMAHSLMNKIYNYMSYQKNITNTNTTASQAFLLKRGVCQDYAQIMLAMLRYLHIPCRYVAGIMENEQYTHAWVEAYLDKQWYGFDPTNNQCVNDMYIVFSRGRDAKDTLVNKGIYFGNSQNETHEVNIIVEESYD